MTSAFPPDGVVLGLDPSMSGTGFAIGRPRDRAPELATVKFSRELDAWPDFFGRVFRWYDGILVKHEPAVVAVELPMPTLARTGITNETAIAASYGMHAIFVGVAQAHKIAVLEVTVATWRKYFLGRGNLKGDDAKRACLRLCEHLHWAPKDHNAAEAAGIWSWGCAQIEPQNVRRVEPLFAGSPHL